jgi:D-alanyl-D-alanine carboxypeptidase
LSYNSKKQLIDQIVSSLTTKKDIFGAVFYFSSEDKSLDIISATGEIKEDSQYYIASINKLFVSAIILRLTTENKLALDDTISKYLPEIIKDLHIYKGKDCSNEITISHLLSQTSGLPCYLIDKQLNGKIAMKELEAGIDQTWTTDKVLKEIKSMKPHFPPGTAGKAKYIDTNHQILSLLIERINKEPINISLQSLFDDLKLSNTYVLENPVKNTFVPIRYKSTIVELPQFLTSTQNDIISTALDQMKFIKAFFSGHFFPKERLHELEKWNSVFFPFQYGIGIQKFQLPCLLTLFNPVSEMIGHCGSTGSVAFYIPGLKIFVTGTINQQSRPSLAFQTILKIINKLK